MSLRFGFGHLVWPFLTISPSYHSFSLITPLYPTVSGHVIMFVSPSIRSEIRDQLKEEEINIYQFPECDSDEDEEFKKQNEEMKV